MSENIKRKSKGLDSIEVKRDQQQNNKKANIQQKLTKVQKRSRHQPELNQTQEQINEHFYAQQKTPKDENLSDSQSADSEDEEVAARIGKVPLKWYDDLQHIGYDINAEKVKKLEQMNKIDEFIQRSENKDWWRTIRDELNQKDIVLTDEQLDILDRIRQGKFATQGGITEDDYDFEFEWKDNMMPISGAPLAKKSFLPSKWERMKVNKLVSLIKAGKITLDKDKKPNVNKDDMLFDIWGNSNDDMTKRLPSISAPKLDLPTHAESYNPSLEYLWDEEEIKQFNEMHPEDRTQNYVPQKFDRLRKIMQYKDFINERFERCLDLYLHPRIQKKKMNVDPEKLIPNLPKPEELRPFPTTQNISYNGHNSRVRSIAVDQTGQFLASCDESGLFIIWEVPSGRILKKIQFEGMNYCLDWSKDRSGGLICLCNEQYLYIINPNCIQSSKYKNNEIILQESKKNNIIEQYRNVTQWTYFEEGTQEYKDGLRIKIDCGENILKYATFHIKGDYIATVAPRAEKRNEQIFIHSINKGLTQKPFNKSKGDIEKVLFHINKPYLFLVTKKNTYIYNLQEQSTLKKLVSGAQWNSSIAIHPQGDNILLGTFDRRLIWYDLDLGTTPYKTLRYHQNGIRQVEYHNKYPLFASCSDDGTIHVFHATIYSDLSQNSLIVPLKVLKGHKIKDDLGVLDIKFHPTQPWIFSAGSDHKILLWT